MRDGFCDVATKEFKRQLTEMGLKLREVQGDGYVVLVIIAIPQSCIY